MEQLDCCNYGLLRSLYLYICVDTVHYLPYLNLSAESIISTRQGLWLFAV